MRSIGLFVKLTVLVGFAELAATQTHRPGP